MQRKRLKKHLFRGSIFTLSLLIFAFKPYKLDDNQVKSKTYYRYYQVGANGLEEGKYQIKPEDNADISNYQIAGDKNFTLETTRDAHLIETDTKVYLYDGEYIKLRNCKINYLGK